MVINHENLPVLNLTVVSKRTNINALWSIGLIFLFSVGRTLGSVNPEVVTNVGTIRGVAAVDGDYSMYMGIPYAYVDKNNPFGEAIPQPPFENIFEANDDTARCPQQEEYNFTIIGTLDCLTLNIYVPNSSNHTNPLPVFVWIYGGYFSVGFNDKSLYGPKYLVRHDVIVIVMNYRLGPYGFMCLHTPEVPGNQGLKDQVKALRWIRDNIAAFGGDPGKVTLAGNSAGASAVDLHVRSDSEQLFDKVIVESGTGLWSVVEPDVMYPLKLAKQAGYETNDTTTALEYLASLPPNHLIAEYMKLGKILYPCGESKFDGVESFISGYTYKADVPKAANTTFMVGYNDDEGFDLFVVLPPESEPTIRYIFYYLLEEGFNFTQDYLNEMTSLVSQFYTAENESVDDFLSSASDFFSDFLSVYTNEILIQDAMSNGATRIYRYLFSYVGDRNYMRVKNGVSVGGAYHADELGYLFDMQMLGEPNEADQVMIDKMTNMWTNFVKYGNPTPTTTELLPVKWLQVAENGSNYLEIGSEFKTGWMRPSEERTRFWDAFFEKNKSYLKGFTLNHF